MPALVPKSNLKALCSKLANFLGCLSPIIFEGAELVVPPHGVRGCALSVDSLELLDEKQAHNKDIYCAALRKDVRLAHSL